jgi:hypothetical protein
VRVFWYPRDAPEVSRRGDLIAAAHRLDCAIDELRADGWGRIEDAIDTIEYHLENLALRLFEARERLLDLTDVAERIGGTRPHRARRGAPELVARVLDLLNDELPPREERAALRVLHLGIWVDGRAIEPRGDHRSAAAGAAVDRRLRAVLRAAIDVYCARAARILELTLAVADTIDG